MMVFVSFAAKNNEKDTLPIFRAERPGARVPRQRVGNAVPGMIRSRRKIDAIIHDAQRFIALRRECGTFSKWLWAFTDGKTLHSPDNAKSDEWTAPARTELSDRIAAELKSRGFKFLGSVTVYAFMQSVGLVNDHARFCFRYKELRNDSPQ